MKKNVGIIIFITIVIIAGFGYGFNIFKLYKHLHSIDPITSIRLVGVFLPPLGSILGYF